MKAVSINPRFISNLPSAFVFTTPEGRDLVVKRSSNAPTSHTIEGVTIKTWVGHVEGLAPAASVATFQVMPGGKLYGTLHFLDTSINANRNFLVSLRRRHKDTVMEPCD